ncbi:hypothetical protein [Jiangella alba]|uniref:hypothetical protein n=1 Tax=Jiangella alba TaxID=561176 RepID=UPI00083F0EFE|nr:hypothetical protein [Jiangella alba]
MPPDPATAPDDGGWTTLASFRDPAQRHRRLERTLWLLVVAVAVAGVVIIGAILTSGPSSEAILPPGTGSRTGGSLSGGAPSLVAGPGGPDDVSGSPGTDGRHHDGTPDGHASPSPGHDDDGHAPPSDGSVPANPASPSPNDGDAPPDHGTPPDRGDTLLSDESAAGDEPAAGDKPGASHDGPPPGWSEVARGFGLAFTRTGVGHEAWFASLSSWLTPEQAAVYRDVPIDAIPTGTLVRVDVGDPASEHAQGTLTYDTGMVLAVGLSYRAGAGSWLVARVELADVAEAG